MRTDENTHIMRVRKKNAGGSKKKMHWDTHGLTENSKVSRILLHDQNGLILNAKTEDFGILTKRHIHTGTNKL